MNLCELITGLVSAYMESEELKENGNCLFEALIQEKYLAEGQRVARELARHPNPPYVQHICTDDPVIIDRGLELVCVRTRPNRFSGRYVMATGPIALSFFREGHKILSVGPSAISEFNNRGEENDSKPPKQ